MGDGGLGETLIPAINKLQDIFSQVWFLAAWRFVNHSDLFREDQGSQATAERVVLVLSPIEASNVTFMIA